MKCLSCGDNLPEPLPKYRHRDYCSAACYDRALNRRFRTVEVQPMTEEIRDSDTRRMAEEHSPYKGLLDEYPQDPRDDDVSDF